MSDTRLIVGLPAGSLADPARGGNLINLLRNAGFPTKGYEKGGPSSFPLAPFLVGWDGRPQEFGAQLGLGEIDVAIAGADWVRERQLEYEYEYGRKIQPQKVLSLQRGDVKIVIIKCDDGPLETCATWLRGLLAQKRLVTMVSEMPYVALDWFRNQIRALGFDQTHAAYKVQKYGTPPAIEAGIVIYETWGKTEAKVKNGSVDFGLEITQTGSAIQNYGLVVVDTVMTSETAVYVNPAIKDDPEKYALAQMFLLNLYGSVFAENKVLVFFNVRNDDTPRILQYLRENKLFGDEPTLKEGPRFTEFSIQMDTDSARLPLAKARYELAQLGATNIETTPLESSIPGLGVLEF